MINNQIYKSLLENHNNSNEIFKRHLNDSKERDETIDIEDSKEFSNILRMPKSKFL